MILLFAGELYSYSYNQAGRLWSAVSPTGEWLRIEEDDECLALLPSRQCFNAYVNGELALNLSSTATSLQLNQGQRYNLCQRS